MKLALTALLALLAYAGPKALEQAALDAVNVEKERPLMTHDPETVERVAVTMAYATRSATDRSADQDEFWAHNGVVTKNGWRNAARAALTAMQPAIDAAVKAERDRCAKRCERWFGTPDADDIARIIHAEILDGDPQ